MFLSGLKDDEQVRAVETAATAAKRISQFLTRDTERDTLTLKPDDDRHQSQVTWEFNLKGRDNLVGTSNFYDNVEPILWHNQI